MSFIVHCIATWNERKTIYHPVLINVELFEAFISVAIFLLECAILMKFP